MSSPKHLPQEPDRVPGLRLLSLASAAVLVGALGVLISGLMLRHELPRKAPTRAFADQAFRPGTPEQTPIETTERGLTLRQAQQKQLAQYGWVDRDAGIVRIPIERAIELRVQGVH